jgi:hypothetical protein
MERLNASTAYSLLQLHSSRAKCNDSVVDFVASWHDHLHFTDAQIRTRGSGLLTVMTNELSKLRLAHSDMAEEHNKNTCKETASRIASNLGKQRKIQNFLVVTLEKLYGGFLSERETMMDEKTTTVDALKYQATIGMMEYLLRHVAVFGRQNQAYEQIAELLTPDFQTKIK